MSSNVEQAAANYYEALEEYQSCEAFLPPGDPELEEAKAKLDQAEWAYDQAEKEQEEEEAEKNVCEEPEPEPWEEESSSGTSEFGEGTSEQAEEPDEVRQEEFRYPGPKPRSKEAALVMLADAIESATRTLNNPTPGNIRNLVSKITKAKFEDEQLNDCDVTLKDIERINRTFSTILTGMYHSRIEYPEEALTGFKKSERKKTGKAEKEKAKRDKK